MKVPDGYTQANAVIESADFSTDHGILSMWVLLNYGDSSGQGFGGYCLFQPHRFNNGEREQWHCGLWVWTLLQVCDVEKLSQCKGKVVRAIYNDSGVYAIGHAIKDVWLCPKEDFSK